MNSYVLAANLVLVFHVAVAMFVVCGLFLIWIGRWREWLWVRHPGFRWSHLICIGVIVLQSWLGKLCPLTTLESRLREHSGGVGYQDPFMIHWLQELLYVEAPPWAFTLAYTFFGCLVIAGWIFVRPRSS